ncbi:hypothetical protein OS493_028115 [Desmophyllum pertusum]|uniref:Polycystin domain-containing protein n=1 Tax=Desmophyllum pertusum TaxID=174260 RepID=A0A9W9ZNZ2_9CNID|nr:hypothetical protein OS493_028115 [Desmophyllum pertusum]
MNEDEDEHGIGNFEHELPEYKKFMYRRYEQRPLTKLEPPDLAELSNAREQRKREIRMSQILKEIITYVLFLLALFVVSFGQRDPKSYLVAKLIEDTYLGGVYTGQQLYETDGVDNYWKWLEGTVLPSLSSSSRDWAEGCHPLQEYTVDCNSRLVGGARVRQVRVSEESCQVPEPLRKTISTCNDFYSYFKEDTNNYNAGWKMINTTSSNMTSSMTSSNTTSSIMTSSNTTSSNTTSSNTTLSNTTSDATISPWNYQTMDELGSIPFLGLVGTYGGGGYSFDLEFSNATGAYLNSLNTTPGLILELELFLWKSQFTVPK